MQAVLLAGGLGTRLRSVVADRPKPMALIGDKPFMEYVVPVSYTHLSLTIILSISGLIRENFSTKYVKPDCLKRLQTHF